MKLLLLLALALLPLWILGALLCARLAGTNTRLEAADEDLRSPETSGQ